MFPEALKRLRKEHGYTMEKLSEIYNNQFQGKMNKSTVSRYESGLQEPMYTVVKNFAELFNVSIDEMLGETVQASSSEFFKFDNILSIHKKKFPLLGEIACGKPVYANEDRESYVEVGVNINADFCLKAKGDSMINARIMDGDIVFICKQEMVENGEIAAVIIDNEATLKRVYYNRKTNILQLVAENPAFPPLVFSGEELNQIYILGKAVAFQSDVK